MPDEDKLHDDGDSGPYDDDREDEIARRVDEVHDESAELHKQFEAQHPGLRERFGSIFDGFSVAEQFAQQAAAERIGAIAWRAFAAECIGTQRETVYLACALLEERSAETLDRLIADGVGS